MMITLFQFPPLFNLLNASPYCMKVEVYLKLAKIPYQVKRLVLPLRAPRGKLPFIKDSGQSIPDSSFILEHLKREYHDLDEGLSDTDKAQTVAWSRLCEEHLSWALYYVRWGMPDHWPRFREAAFAQVPMVIRPFIGAQVRKQVLAQIKGQGLGRLTEDEIFQRADMDIRALSVLLGEKLFLLDTQPRSLDAVVYAFLANILHDPFPSQLKVSVNKNPNLLAYCARMEELLDEIPEPA